MRARLYGLVRFASAKGIEPEADDDVLAAFLRYRAETTALEIENDLALMAYPRDRFDRVITTEKLLEAGLTLVKELSSPFIDGGCGGRRSFATG